MDSLPCRLRALVWPSGRLSSTFPETPSHVHSYSFGAEYFQSPAPECTKSLNVLLFPSPYKGKAKS